MSDTILENEAALAAGLAALLPAATNCQRYQIYSYLKANGHPLLAEAFSTAAPQGRAYAVALGAWVVAPDDFDGVLVYESEADAVGREVLRAADPYGEWSTEALAAEAERLYEAWALAVGGDAIRAEASFCRRAVDPDDRDRRGWFCSVTARGSEGDGTFGGAYFTIAGAAHAAIDNLRQDLTARKERAERRIAEERARTSEMLAALDLTAQGLADALVPGGKRAAA
jgi:hypothetical protein